ncbi:response regulator [Pseudomonas asuensis]|uniref:Response regulator n=2 Tax=Pseudomonas asuensis TaxID=1825787 RepID=A0ABQ2H3C1_9PSED|nr:response regulator [Pseudomonas asuensis]GGM27423.1 response regulator [Pseudomonas asuensis]
MTATPLLVCDDSAMARKQLIRALPSEWSVDITQATNGSEALSVLRQGQVKVMLLDLTMPVMDGYQTLQAMRAENINCSVIVVSGDVQEEAIRRVLELGALAFLKKPADAEQLKALLLKHDLLTSAPNRDAAIEDRPDPEVNFRDAFREVVNVSIGRAAALLAKVLNVFVQLPVPNVNILEVGELHMALADVQRGSRVTAVCQGFIGNGISGEALLIFHDSEVKDMVTLLRGGSTQNNDQMEMLLDLASILIGACLSGLSEQIDVRFSQGHPMILGQHTALESLIQINRQRWKKTLAVEVSYSLEGHDIHFDLLLLFTEDSVKRLTNKINYMMD